MSNMPTSIIAAASVGALTSFMEALGLTALRSKWRYGLVTAMFMYGAVVVPLLK